MRNKDKEVKLIHTADLHLGFSYNGMKEKAEERQRENLETFLYIISLCGQKQIDILLIAGDLFDFPRPESKLLETVRNSFAQIEHTLVIISPGNHDYYQKNGIYDDIEAWSDNVYIFHGEMDCFEFLIRETKVRIYGAAFTNRYQYESLICQRKMTKDIAINIGLFHGEIVSVGAKSQYNKITASQMEDNRFSYVALGHLHATQGLGYAGQVAYAYSGSPEGHGFDETGEKGIYIGEINYDECNMKFLKTCRRQYIVEQFNIESFDNIIELSKGIHSYLNNIYGSEYLDYIYRIKFIGYNHDINLNRMSHYLNEFYYIEIIDETQIFKDEDSNTNGMISELFSDKLNRLIQMEEENENCDEVKIKRYKKALEIGMTAIKRHCDY